MKAWQLQKVGDLSLEHVAKPEPNANEVIVKVKACGICGSDIPRVFYKGTYSFPTIPGHELSGVIDQVGRGVPSDHLGKKVAVFPLIPCMKCSSCQIGRYAQCEDYDYIGSRCDGGFAEYVRVPFWNLLFVPEEVSFEEAAMVEPAAVAVHALRQAKIDIGDKVLISGAGPIGLLLASLAKIWGAEKCLLVDISDEKVQFAKDLGFEHVYNAKNGDLEELIRKETDGSGADVAIEGAGNAISLQNCLNSVRQFATVVLMGNPAGEMKIPQKEYWQILRKELVVKGTWNSIVSSLPKNEWDLVLQLLHTKVLKVNPFITHRIGMDDLFQSMKLMESKGMFYNKVMLVNPEGGNR